MIALENKWWILLSDKKVPETIPWQVSKLRATQEFCKLWKRAIGFLRIARS